MNLRELSAFLIQHGISGAAVDTQVRPASAVALSDLVAHAAGLDLPKEGGFLTDLWPASQEIGGLYLSVSAVARDNPGPGAYL